MILLDTHALLWWQAGSAMLSRAAQRAIAGADRAAVNPISCWEIGMLLAQGRLSLDRDLHAWINDIVEDQHVVFVEMTPHIAATAAGLRAAGFNGDPVDQIIYATAIECRVPLVSKDRLMTAHAAAHGDVRVIW